MALLRVFAVLVMVIPFGFGYAESNRNITKCKDTNGVWHYGDFAADNCASDSDVTEMNQQGVKIKVDQATPDLRDSATLSEVSRRKQEQLLKEQQARDRDNRLLSMYESVDDLIKKRDERVEYLSEIIRTDQDVLGQLHKQHSILTDQYRETPNKRLESEIESTESSMELYERVIEDRLRQKTEVAQSFDVDIERYRNLVLLQKARERAQAGY